MTTYECPKCGHRPEACATHEASNSKREVMLSIPEHHWPIFRMVFSQMNVRFGMMGLGEFANLLPDYDKQIPLDHKRFRYFDDTAVAYAFLGMEMGYRLKTRIEPGGKPDYEGNARMNVFGELHPAEGGKVLKLTLSDCAPEDRARDVCAYLEEAASRIAPL